MPPDILKEKIKLLERKLESISIQSGEVEIPCPNLRDSHGDRYEHSEFIKFTQSFNSIPKVMAAFSLIDAWGEDGWIRANVTVDNQSITSSGFKVTVSTWHCSKVHAVKISWLAYTI